jgi:hypothetical protein
MGAGGGGKTSTSTSSSPYAAALWGLGSKFAKAALPLYSQSVSTAENALQTGGVGGQIPSINRAVDANRQASSQAMESTRQSLARLGLSDSPFAQDILASQNQRSNDTAASIAPDAASQIIGGIAGLVGLGQRGFGPMGEAAGLDTTTTSTQDPWAILAQSFGAGAQAGGSFYHP